MRIAFNPSTVEALITPPNNKDITFDLRGHNIFARGVKFLGTDTNTWRDIKINNVSIGSHTLDLRDGDNTTLTNTNGVVTINSTWRPVVDNLTSDSTTSSLSANLGRVLKSLIDGKSDSGHNHDDRYLKLTGGTMASNALITFADSGSWGTDKGPQGARGGLYWIGQSDYAKLYAEETAGDNLDLVIQFGDDNSNGLSIRNKANTQTSYISAGGVITTGTFKGNLDWSYITNKPATATRWPSWAEVTGKPSSFTPSTHTHGLSNSVFFLNMPSISGNAKWKEVFGYPVNYNLLLSVRINSPAPEWCVGNFGSGILYGGSDTKGFMSSAYNEPFIMWAGGNGSSDDSVPKWYIGIKGIHKSIYNLATITSEANAAYNLRHSHANKSVLDGITSALVNNWNVAYTFVNTITGTDTDKVINKWDEIVNFLAGITEDNKLNTLLNSKLSIYELANNTNVGAIKNNGIYYSTSDASSGTLTNSPFNTGFTLINMTSYDGGDVLRRSRLAFNAYGEIKVSDDRDLANTAETWYNVLTSKNSGISGSTIKLNGTSITVYSSSTADGRYVKKSGDTMSGALNFANNTWNKVGDDVYMGDHNIGGLLCIMGANGTTGLSFHKYGDASIRKSITFDGNTLYMNGSCDYATLSNLTNLLAINTVPNKTTATSIGSWSPISGRYVFHQKWTDTSTGGDSADFGIYLDGNLTANMVLDGYYNSLLGFRVIGASGGFLKANGTIDNNTYLTSHLSLSNYYTKSEVDTKLNSKLNYRLFWERTNIDLNSITEAWHTYEVNNGTGTANTPTNASWHQAVLWGTGDTDYAVLLCTSYTSNYSLYLRHKIAGKWYNWIQLAATTDIPTSLKNPYALTISLNGTSQGPYDGSAAKNINITPSSIGAATSDHNHDGRYVRYYAVTTLDCNNLAAGLTSAGVSATNAAHTNHSAFLYISDVGTPFQIQIPDSSVPYIYKRYYGSGGWSGWFKLNAGYADSAGNADTLDGNHASAFATSEHKHNNYLVKTTYDYHGEISFGSSGKCCLGKFPMYDSCVTIDIVYTTSGAYFGKLVIGTLNINNSRGGNWTARVFGDDSGVITYRLSIRYASGSNLFLVYFNCEGWGKFATKIHCCALAGTPSDICTLVTSIPTDNLIGIIRAYNNPFNFLSSEAHIGCNGAYSDPLPGVDVNFKFGGVLAATHIYSNGGFYKNGSNDSYVLLGGGGHKTISDFATASSLNNYVTLTTALTISGVKTFSTQLKFTVGSGTAPFTVSSNTLVTNLNADLLDGYHANGLLTALSNSNNGISVTVGGTTKSVSNISVNYASSAGNANTVDGYHASSLVKFYLSPMTNNAPADSAKSWFIDTMPSASAAIVYNTPGSEKTIIAGKSSGAYGHMLQLNYDDNYLRILRYRAGSWQSTDWEKISAGYADSAGSVAWNNVTGKPSTFAPSAHSHNYAANENYGGFTKSGRLPISGFYQSCESESGDNAPWSDWMHLINCLHSNTNNNFALLIAASFFDNNTFKIRVTADNVNNAWRDIIHSGNIGSQSVNYANSAGNADTALYLRSLGNLNCQTGRTLNYGDVYSYNTYSGNTGSPTEYTSVIGFGRGIAGTVEIAGGWCNTHLYWRSLRDCCEDWYSWRTVLDSNNYTEFINNYYWANVKISTSSSTTTSPTVSNLTATSSVKAGDILLGHGNEINSDTGLYLNYRSSNNVGLCQGGGNVGIGTTSPSYKLDVNGDIRSLGTINCNALNVSSINGTGSPLTDFKYNGKTIMYYNSEAVNINKKLNIDGIACLLGGLALYSSLSIDKRTSTDTCSVLIGSISNFTFTFKKGVDGLILFMKWGDTSLDVRVEGGCKIIRSNDFYHKTSSYGDSKSRIFIYLASGVAWYEFYCG